LSKITIIVPDDKDATFRKLVIDVYGVTKGALAKGCLESIDLFIREHTLKPASKKQSSQLPEIRPVAVPEKEYVF